jgi:CysZ protein
MHSFLEDLRAAHQGSRSNQISAGLKLPLGSVRFLLANKRLLPFVIMPALINLLLFAGSAVLLIMHAGDLLGWLWQKPAVEHSLDVPLVTLWYVAYVVSILLALVVSYVIVLVSGGILASPFHDFLSENTEQILLGVDELPDTGESMIAGLIRSVFSSALIGVTYGLLMIPILLLNVIPLAGSVAATILGASVSAYFVSLEYTDPTLERHGMRIRDKFRLIWDNLPLCASFGLGTSFLLWIPLLNFVCMPIAVIGGTALGLVLEDAGATKAETATALQNAEGAEGAEKA